MRPDGLPIWTSDAMPGHLHDLTCAQRLDVTGALYWAASELRLPTLTDSGYEGAGQGIHAGLATRQLSGLAQSRRTRPSIRLENPAGRYLLGLAMRRDGRQT